MGISNIIESGWSICYETKLKDKTFIRAWGIYRGIPDKVDFLESIHTLDLHHFIFIREVDVRVLGHRGSPVRLESRLMCTEDYRPVLYEQRLGKEKFTIHFSDTAITATLPDGSVNKGIWEGADFLLAGNMVPQLALKIRLLKDENALPYYGAFFSPDSLQIIPYELTDNRKGLFSSLEEHIRLSQEGWIEELILPSKEISILRAKAKLPRWYDSKGTPSEKVRPKKYRPPPTNMVNLVDVMIPGPVVDLGATLALPTAGIATRAVALFIGGSGRHDRHGISNGVDLGYHELLDRIAGHGIASLRFDKRGAGKTALGPDLYEFSFERIVDDAQAALVFLYSRPETNGLPIFLIGHSQGGLIALILAGDCERIDGIILMATAGRPIDSVLEDQVRIQAKELGLSRENLALQIEELKSLFHCVRDVRDWTPETVPPKIYAAKHMHRWYAELLDRDPLRLVTDIHCPLLILQGDQDQQVSTRDAELLYRAATSTGIDVESILFRGCDHLFKRVGSVRGIRAYYDGRRHVVPSIIKTVTQWILRVAGEPIDGPEAS